MRLALFLHGLFLTILASAATAKFSFPENHFLVLGCQIFTVEGKLVKAFPGVNCIFLEDGGYLSATPSKMSRLSAQGRLLWSRDIITHHMMNLTADKEKVALLTAKIRKEKGKVVRYTGFALVSVKTGKILGHIDTLDYKKVIEKNAKKNGYKPIPEPYIAVELAPWEYGHFNSIHEIPANSLELSHPVWKRGNFLVSLNWKGKYAVLDSKVHRIMHFFEMPAMENEFHDLQLLPEGRVLVYANSYNMPPKGLKLRTRIFELEPEKKEISWEMPIKDQFYTDIGGGVIPLAAGAYLVSRGILGSGGDLAVYDRFGNLLKQISLQGIAPLPVIRPELRDLRLFFKNSLL